jgi:glycosyltransferase involved in cell wall biosynthesis
MRVAWIVPGFEGTADEPGVPALGALARALAGTLNLQVFTVRYPPRAERYCLDGIPVRSFGPAAPSAGVVARRAASAQRWGRVLAALASEHRRAPFALVHGFWATEPGMLATVAGRMLALPVLVSCCGGELAAARPAGYGSQLRHLERAQVASTLHLATRIGAGSVDQHRRLLARYPWLAGRIHALPLGYDPALFPPCDDDEAPSPGQIICIASWSPVKGHDLLLDAMRLLVARDARAHLVLLGERTDGPAARAAVARRGLEAHVRLLGAVPQGRVEALTRRAQVAVIASWHEAQCLAVVEALACGVPVVATPVGMARELLREPVVGTCIAARSPALLADALHQYLNEAQHSQESRAARRQAVAHLALPETAQRFLSVYHDMSSRGQVVSAPH